MFNAFFHPLRALLHFIKQLVKIILTLILILALAAAGINLWVTASTHDDIGLPQDYGLNAASTIMVLGAGINADGTPDEILRQRLDTACALYGKGAAPTVIISGGASEIIVMERYLENQGIPVTAIIEDEDGYDTYHSMTDLTGIAQGRPVIVVSQRFHLYRSLYIADQLGLQATGCAAPDTEAVGLRLQEREFFARIKDFCQIHLPQRLLEPAGSLYHYLAQQTAARLA
jgi:SanA protein